MASDKDHRPCLPLKPQEKNINNYILKKYLLSKKYWSMEIWKLMFCKG